MSERDGMGIVGWIIVGFVAGALGKAVTGTRVRLGCLGTILVGICGGLLGGVIFNAAAGRGIGRFGLWSMFVAFVGAVILLLVVGLFTDRQRRW